MSTADQIDALLGIEPEPEEAEAFSSSEAPASETTTPVTSVQHRSADVDEDDQQNQALGVQSQRDWLWPPNVNTGGPFDSFDVPWSLVDMLKIMAGLEIIHWSARWASPLLTDTYWQTLGLEAVLQVVIGGCLVLFLLKDYLPELPPESSLFFFSLNDKEDSNEQKTSDGADAMAAVVAEASKAQIDPQPKPKKQLIKKTDMFGGYYLQPKREKRGKEEIDRLKAFYNANPWRRAGGVVECLLLTSAALQMSGVQIYDIESTKNAIIHEAMAGGATLTTLYDLGALTVTAVLLVPAVSEVIFRGICLPSLSKHMPIPLAILVGGGIFAVMEKQFTSDSVHIAGLVLLGVVTGYAYCRTRNLATSMMIHSSFNATLLVIYLSTPYLNDVLLKTDLLHPTLASLPHLF